MDIQLKMNLTLAFERRGKMQNMSNSQGSRTFHCQVTSFISMLIHKTHFGSKKTEDGMKTKEMLQCILPDVPFLCGWGGWEQD